MQSDVRDVHTRSVGTVRRFWAEGIRANQAFFHCHFLSRSAINCEDVFVISDLGTFTSRGYEGPLLGMPR